MDVTPTTPQTRPTPGKSNAAKTTAAPPQTSAKSARRRKTPAAAEQPEITITPTSISEEIGEEVSQRIATTAYFLAASRNFEPGHELEDWLEAERQIRTSA